MKITPHKLLLFFGLIVSSLPALPLNAASLYPVVVNGRWGYIKKSGDVVVNPQFERADAFSGDRAAVRMGRWGYAEPSGKIVINPQFDRTEPFSEGLAVIELTHRHGYINADGKYVVSPQFD